MISFYSVLLAEMYKSRRTYGMTLSILLPLVVTLFICIFHIKEADTLIQSRVDPWLRFSQYSFQFYTLLYPLMVGLIAFLMANVEHKNLGFKLIFTQPAPRSYFYYSKAIILIFWLMQSIFIAYVSILCSGAILNRLEPDFDFNNYPFPEVIATYLIKLFLALAGILTFQFLFSMYFPNFIVSLGLLFILLILGTMFSSGNWEYTYLFPFSHPHAIYMDYFRRDTFIITTPLIKDKLVWSMGYGVLFMGIGYLMINRKK